MIEAPALTQWRELPAPAPALRCVVVVPVRNEAAHLEAALDALAAQAETLPLPPSAFEVLLLANNCDDDSAPLARRFARRRPRFPLRVVDVTLSAEQSHIGFVRRELMNEAWRRLRRAGRRDGIIASTDADSRVARDWLAATVAEIDKGADAVGGRIAVEDETRPSPSTLRTRRIDAVHSLLRCRAASLLDPDAANPWPHHHQHFGASLAVRAAAYAQVGGVPEVEFLEDDALVRAFERADLRVRRSPAVRVTTSGRLDGRARVGLSWQLRQWSERPADDPPCEAARDVVAALQARAALRAAWSRRGPSLAAPSAAVHERMVDVGIDRSTLARCLSGATTFGAAWERVDAARLQALAESGALVPRSQAVAGLRRWLRDQPRR